MTARYGVNAISMGCIPYDDDTASLYHVSAPRSLHDDQVQGAALEEAFRLLFDAVKEMKDKAPMFKTILNNLNDTLEYLEPLITEFNMPEEEATKFQLEMKKGAELVRKCSEVHRSNFCIKNRYTAKLRKLDKILKKLLNDPPQLPSITVRLDAPLTDLKEKLLNKNGTSIVIVTAPGGCGKTLLAQTFCRDGHVREKFKSNIFFVTVSKTPPSLILVVQELYKYKMNMVPLLQNEADAAKRLKQFLKRLKSRPILMVLDDVWPEAESLIKKFVFKIRDYKILITSRYELPKFAPPYHLSPLNDEDAMTLFRHSACWEDGEPGIPDYIVKKVYGQSAISTKHICIFFLSKWKWNE
ncbi:protein DA1-related 5 [Ziziphus jujuba]|uniref:Protein DA1-related 5 n=1 Tax=Ziziphus jujuba TaxID=326968 RepID=A0ABM4A7V6_ZIZJJ|nr:protein DA1-related 5 [Ziziphus jujuba]